MSSTTKAFSERIAPLIGKLVNRELPATAKPSEALPAAEPALLASKGGGSS